MIDQTGHTSIDAILVKHSDLIPIIHFRGQMITEIFVKVKVTSDETFVKNRHPLQTETQFDLLQVISNQN